MNFTYIKYLNYINKRQKIHWIDLSTDFKIDKNEAREVVKFLRENGYISPVGDTQYISTLKGKRFIKDFILNYLYNNLLALLAIIISLIALFK